MRDLRPGEFWTTHGTAHANTQQQFFAYDVCVSTDGTWGTGRLLPGTDGTMNEHYRLWGKPIHAIADGNVADFCNDFPTNQVPGQVDPAAAAYDFKGQPFHGNGNFFTIADTSKEETILYAHMQPGTLNPALLKVGNAVKKGDFLGLAGNAGAASEPHLHIHANRTPTSGGSWLGFWPADAFVPRAGTLRTQFPVERRCLPVERAAQAGSTARQLLFVAVRYSRERSCKTS